MTNRSTLQQQRMDEAKLLLKELGMSVKQQNDRTAWVLLALCGIKSEDELWNNFSQNLLTTRAIMDFIRDEYGFDYKPNSRETIRKHSLHQLEQACIIVRNVDDKSRPTNSKDNNYSISDDFLSVIEVFPKDGWRELVVEFTKKQPELAKAYEYELEQERISITLPCGKIINLSPGPHNKLHAAIIDQFIPEFANDGRLLYIGDTASSRVGEGGKMLHMDDVGFAQINLPLFSHDKLPDVVYLDTDRNWLFLIEAVTSHGPVSNKRLIELKKQLENCTAGLVFVTAFPDKATFKKFANEIAWETEVWIATRPKNMVHFNGDRFLGPR